MEFCTSIIGPAAVEVGCSEFSLILVIVSKVFCVDCGEISSMSMERMRELFIEFDKDGDGGVSYHELLLLLAKLGYSEDNARKAAEVSEISNIL